MAKPLDADWGWIVEPDVWDQICPTQPHPEMSHADLLAHAERFSNFLGHWAVDASFALRSETRMNSTRSGKSALDCPDGRVVRSILQSMRIGVERIDQTTRPGIIIYVSTLFIEVANQIEAWVRDHGAQLLNPDDGRVLRRIKFLARASMDPRPVRIDRTGHVFDPLGMQLTEFRPTSVLRGLEEIAAGEVVSLDDLQAADSRNG